MNLNINLATRVYINFKQVNFLLIIAFLLCSFWLAFNLYSSVANFEQIYKYTELISKGKKAEGKLVSEADYSKFLSRIKYTNGILYKHSYDWLSLLENLERLIPNGVSLKSLEPSNKGENLKLSGVATGFDSVRKFVESLENSKTFTDIYLTEQTNIKFDNKKKGVNFTITCKASKS